MLVFDEKKFPPGGGDRASGIGDGGAGHLPCRCDAFRTRSSAAVFGTGWAKPKFKSGSLDVFGLLIPAKKSPFASPAGAVAAGCDVTGVGVSKESKSPKSSKLDAFAPVAIGKPPPFWSEKSPKSPKPSFSSIVVFAGTGRGEESRKGGVAAGIAVAGSREGPASAGVSKKSKVGAVLTACATFGVLFPLVINSNRPFDGVADLALACVVGGEGVDKSRSPNMSTCERDRLLAPNFGIEAAEDDRFDRGGGASREGNATGFDLSIDSRPAISSF